MTDYVRAVPGVNQDLVVGVGFPLNLLGAVGSWGLTFAEGGQTKKKESHLYRSLLQIKPKGLFDAVCSQSWRFTCQTWEG